MTGRKIKTATMIALLVFILITPSSLLAAHPPHYNYDDADLDLSAVFSSLNLTKEEMVSSLDHNIQVNYSQTYHQEREGYEYGFMNDSYDDQGFNLTFEAEEQINADLSNVKELIKEIDDDVPSYVYLRKYYLPFYDLSENLTSLSENHHSFVLNMTKSVDIFNSISKNETTDVLYPDLMQTIDNASLALERMENRSERMERDIVHIEETVEEGLFDFTEMRAKIDEVQEMIDRYRDCLSIFIAAQKGLPAFLTARHPETVHPGEMIKIEGIYVGGYLFSLDSQKYELEEGPVPEDLKEAFIERDRPIDGDAWIEQAEKGIWFIKSEGTKMYRIEKRDSGGMEKLDIYLEQEFSNQENITIFLDGKEIAVNETRDGYYYSSELKIPWNIFSEESDWQLKPGDEVELKVLSDQQNISPESKNLTVEKWSAGLELLLEEEKEEVFDENISIKGEFVTRAPIDFSMVELSVYPESSIDKDSGNFTFHFTFHTQKLDWGENLILVSYMGNETIDPATEEISIKKNIPTELTIDSNKDKDGIEYLEVQGRLLNVSAEEGLENKEVVLKTDGSILNETTTISEGSYNFSIPVDSLSEGQVLYVHFEGDRMFRECRSEGLVIGESDLDGDGSDEETRIHWSISTLLGMLTSMSLIALVWHWKRKKRISKIAPTKDKSPEREGKNILRLEKKKLKADSVGEISDIYGRLLSTLNSKGFISLEKGKTHREVERELASETDLEEEIGSITSILEKALFTDHMISSADLQMFNASLERLEEELL
ncbi:MAG: hypothetical protein ACLFVL_03045 [Candidatus Aenigmatarchaeota archaeon]